MCVYSKQITRLKLPKSFIGGALESMNSRFISFYFLVRSFNETHKRFHCFTLNAAIETSASAQYQIYLAIFHVWIYFRYFYLIA